MDDEVPMVFNICLKLNTPRSPKNLLNIIPLARISESINIIKEGIKLKYYGN